MNHNSDFNNVSYIDSEEFKKFLDDNGFDKKIFDKHSTDKLADAPTLNQQKKQSIGKRLLNIIDNWCIKHPGASLIIVLGGSTFICYKMSVGIISQAVFKGNLKTSRYFDRHA